jgi:hypothetical protein
VATPHAAGTLGPGDPGRIAEVLWSAAHGAVSLELAGHLAGDEAAQVYAELTAAAAARFAV